MFINNYPQAIEAVKKEFNEQGSFSIALDQLLSAEEVDEFIRLFKALKQDQVLKHQVVEQSATSNECKKILTAVNALILRLEKFLSEIEEQPIRTSNWGVRTHRGRVVNENHKHNFIDHWATGIITFIGKGPIILRGENELHCNERSLSVMSDGRRALQKFGSLDKAIEHRSPQITAERLIFLFSFVPE